MTTPEYHHNEDFQIRSRKLAEVRQLGMNPYPHRYSPTTTAHELFEKYQTQDVGHSEDAAAGKTLPVTVAGRLVLFRSMGKNAFGHIQDDAGRIQVMFNRDATKVTGYTGTEELSPFKFIEKTSGAPNSLST